MKEKIKILHLEDTPTDAELIERELRKGKINFEKLVVSNKPDFAKALKDFSPDVILSDHSLHSFDSHEALRMVKNTGMTVPFILVTSAMSDEFAVTIMKEGAHDYIIKDRLTRLPAAILNLIEKHDLKEEKEAEHERLMFHIENAPLGFIEWDHRGFAKSWSVGAEEIFGWSGKEFIENQQTGFAPVYEEDIPRVSKILEELINGEIERNKVQYRNITKDGRVIWCEWFNSVLKDKTGKVKTIMSLVQDITEQKQLEWQKDNFLTIASHELKTPLTTIKAYAQIAESILERKGDRETLGMIKTMGSQVNKLTALVKELLDFTRIQKGLLMYNDALFDFNELLKEVINDMQVTTRTHKIKNNSGETAIVYGDKDKISQALNNLISNAIKYSPKANQIIISTRLENDGIELSVQDFGIGISVHEQKNVFEQFYRVDKDNQSTFPGMGIGLHICSEIISRHGGKIWVESNINEGSTFYFWIPLQREKSV